MRIKDKKKFISRIAVLLLVLLFMILLSQASFSKVEYGTKTIYVAGGDTLWTIASEEQECNSFYEGKKIQDVLDHIIEINNLDTSYIYEGQKLEIPTL